jgi:hypothetical protein
MQELFRGLWGNGIRSLAFSSLPDASQYTGVIFKCDPLVAGQNFFYVVSDGTYYRPFGGDQVLYNLSAPIDMAVNNSNQKLVSIPFPALLMPDGRASVEVVMGWDKLLGTSDTLTISAYFGTANSSSDQLAFPQSSLATTNITLGIWQKFARISATTTRKLGSPAIATFSSVSASARGAAVTVGNMDSVTNYLNIYGAMTTGATEKGELHALTVRLIG